MAIDKQHLEFQVLDMEAGWETPPGYPPGIEQKILAGNLDEEEQEHLRGIVSDFESAYAKVSEANADEAIN